MRAFTVLILAAALCFGLAAREALAQPTQVSPMPSIPHNWHPSNPQDRALFVDPAHWHPQIGQADSRGGVIYLTEGAPTTTVILAVECATGKVTLHGKPWNRDPAMVKALRKVANCKEGR